MSVGLAKLVKISITTVQLLQLKDFQYRYSGIDLELSKVSSEVWRRC